MSIWLATLSFQMNTLRAPAFALAVGKSGVMPILIPNWFCFIKSSTYIKLHVCLTVQKFGAVIYIFLINV